MSGHMHITQWKSAGRRQPCCKFDDGKEGFTRRNKKIRRGVKSLMRRIRKDGDAIPSDNSNT